MSITKYGTPNVCPECGGPMMTTKSTGASSSRACTKCSYKATTFEAKPEPENGSRTAATPETKEAEST